MTQTLPQILNASDLPGETSRRFEGYLHGDVHVSFFVSATPPGRGPSLHKHPYEEVFVVQAGTLTFVVGEATVEAGAGQIVIVPPDTPHKFTNTGTAVAHHLDIHTSGTMETTWLED
jgi:mannose-6-phosphate isomerase-like protein (cupin superfamily)